MSIYKDNVTGKVASGLSVYRLDRENETDFKTRISYEARSADVGTRTNVKA